MKRLLIFSLAFSLLPAVSAVTEESPSTPVQVEVGPAYGGVQRFPRSANSVVRRRSATAPKTTLPEPSTRREAFGKVTGLDSSIQGMDELDRDLLYVRAGSLSSAELTKKYPGIPKEQLSRLHDVLREKR